MATATAKEDLFRSLGSYLRDKREKKGMTQTDVASSLKVRPQFVSNWERGLSSPPWRLMRQLVRVYNIPKNEIVKVLVKEHESFIRQNLGVK
ncbi:MAG: helix-turn-helix transcriptional regulator [Bdellovibrionaceae bacterium]|nr:helix-turn-helix transcriptional regulator [Pseudobdellovibrionaceae bacterium]MBX3032806.1 helix-turn-helix transcriptional regulator [Pseudobdellovibrionaceae bacterium]